MNKKTINWKCFAVGEGLIKTTAISIQKLVGIKSPSAEYSLYSTLIMAITQTALGLALFLQRNWRNAEVAKEFFPGVKIVLWSFGFGVLAATITILGFWTFILGADLGINRFFAAVSVLPGMFLDRIMFGNQIGKRQLLGIMVFVCAAFAILDFPSPGSIRIIPLWIWPLCAMCVLLALNEALMRKTSAKMHIWTNNFWVGLSQIICCFVGLAIVGVKGRMTLDTGSVFWIGSITMGTILIVMHSFKLLSYATGEATIALKKIVMQSTQLISSLAVGTILYNESLSLGKMIGVALFVAALPLSDNDAWQAVRLLAIKKKTV